MSIVTLDCHFCGASFSIYPSRLKRKVKFRFCSCKCATTFRNLTNYGIYSGRYTDATNIDRDGYIRKWCPLRKRFIGEHRLVVERHLGRLLSTKEIVHHKDHNRTNNNIENLEVMNHTKHASLHKQGLI